MVLAVLESNYQSKDGCNGVLGYKNSRTFKLFKVN